MVAVANDSSQIASADSITGWNVDGALSMPAVETVSQIEGTGCIEARQSAGLGIGAFFVGSTGSYIDRHLYFWQRPTFPVDSFANGGIRLRTADGSSDASADFGEWNIGGNDKGIRPFKGWFNSVVDLHRPFDTSTGAPPTSTGITTFAGAMNFLAGSGKDAPVFDEVKTATFIRVSSGSSATPATFSDISADDNTNGEGFFKEAGGAFYCNIASIWGSTAGSTEDLWFQDSNKVLIFEDLPVSGSLYIMRFEGSSAATGSFVLGSGSGSSNAREGSGGGTILAAGDAPFRLESLSSDVAVGLYGVSITGPSTLYNDALRRFTVEDKSAGSFTDDTFDANSTAAADANYFPATPGSSDAPYFGHDERFSQLLVNTGTAGVGTYTVTWEYSQGSSSWGTLGDITDGSSSFKATGEQTVSYSIPDDWARDLIDGSTRYWIRARHDGGTTTTPPVGSQMKTVLGGGVRWESPNSSAIRCTFTNKDTIRVRNGGVLKKCTITDSVAPAKSGALDLGASDPELNTVRDLVIQNCNKAILLQGNSTSAEFNLRNIQLANNTNPVRLDFAATDNVVINIVEGGTAFSSSDVDNVNGTTLTVNAAITLQVTVKDEAGSAVQNARVAIYSDPEGPSELALMNQLTNASGVASVSINDPGVTPVSVRVRRATGGTIFEPVNSPQTIDGDFTLTVTLGEDTVSAGWTPNLLPDLITWIDTDDSAEITLNSSKVSAIGVKAGLDDALSYTQASTGQQPDQVTITDADANAKAMDFAAGSSEELDLSGLTGQSIGAGGFYLAYYAKAEGLSSTRDIVYQIDTGRYFGTFDSSGAPVFVGTGANVFGSLISQVSTGAGLVMEFWRGSTSDIHCRVNNTEDTDSLSDSITFFGGSSELSIGTEQGSTRNWDGIVGDIIACESLPPQRQRDEAMMFLANKFGVNIST